MAKDEQTGPPSHESTMKAIHGFGGSAASGNLDDLTVAELHERAKAAGVTGYSSMHKDELVKEVKKAEKAGGTT